MATLPTMRITWLGHATVLIELDGVRLLTDPVLRPRVAHLRRVAPHLAATALTPPDAVLISHLHHDHLDVRSLQGVGQTRRVVVPRGGAGLLRRRGFRDVTEVVAGDVVEVGPVAVRATRAVHDGRRVPLGRPVDSLGYVVEGSARVYFAGDTDLFDGMRDIAPSLDVALLPVGGWGGRLPPGHLDPRGAAQALLLLQPRIAIPIHWGTYRQMGLRDTFVGGDHAADEFARLAAELAPAVEVHTLAVGDGLDVPVNPHAAAPGALSARHEG